MAGIPIKTSGKSLLLLAPAGGILGRFENVRVKKSAKKTVTCDVGDQVWNRVCRQNRPGLLVHHGSDEDIRGQKWGSSRLKFLAQHFLGAYSQAQAIGTKDSFALGLLGLVTSSLRVVSLVDLDEAATPEYLRHDFLKPQLLPQSLARRECDSVQERVWLEDEEVHCRESFRHSLLVRHLPIERVDEEANFIATSNINETRFHKVGPHLV